MARNSKSGASGGQDGEADPAAGDVAGELAKLRRSVDALAQGLTQMLDATQTHTEMLAQLLAAATAPTEPEREVADLLKAVVSRLAEQSALLRSLGATMTQLPEDVGGAVASQMASAMATLR